LEVRKYLLSLAELLRFFRAANWQIIYPGATRFALALALIFAPLALDRLFKEALQEQ